MYSLIINSVFKFCLMLHHHHSIFPSTLESPSSPTDAVVTLFYTDQLPSESRNPIWGYLRLEMNQTNIIKRKVLFVCFFAVRKTTNAIDKQLIPRNCSGMANLIYIYF